MQKCIFMCSTLGLYVWVPVFAAIVKIVPLRIVKQFCLASLVIIANNLYASNFTYLTIIFSLPNTEGKEEVDEELVVPSSRDDRRQVITEEVVFKEEKEVDHRAPTLATEEPTGIDESYRDERSYEEKPFTPPSTPTTKDGKIK